ncbi:MAG: peptidylprolyl isomerase [Planctomycetota bacterium]
MNGVTLRRLLPACVLLAAAPSALAGGNGGEQAPEARPFEYAVVTVNSRPVTRSYIRTRISRQLKQLAEIKAQRRARGMWTQQDEEQYRGAITRLQLMVIRGVVFGEILRGEAEAFVKKGYVVPQRAVDKHWRNMLKEHGGPQGLYESEGMSVPALKEMAKDEVLAQAYRENLRMTTAKPTPKEIADYYKYHNEEFRKPASVRARIIKLKRFVYDEKTGARVERKTARKLAEDLLARLKRGEDFGKLARRYSEDPKSAAQDGLLGDARHNNLTERKDLDRRLAEALFSAELKESVGLVEGPAHFYIAEVLRRIPEGVPPLEEIENDVYVRCYRDRIRQAEEDLFRQCYHKVLVRDPKGRPIPIEKIWPRRKPRADGGLFRREG